MGTWLAQASLALLLAVTFVIGPRLADRAWDSGVHVTPEQAAMHNALMAEGFTHHHGPLSAHHTSAVPLTEGTALQSPGIGVTWGGTFSQTLQPELPDGVNVIRLILPPSDQPAPHGADVVPSSPPPEVQSASIA